MKNSIDNETWQGNSLLIKSFIEQRDDYEQLCQEVAYILEKTVETAGVEYSAISYRVKTLKSYLEKIRRKAYKDPLKEITDFAGVRLIFLYNSDFKEIEALINDNFYVLEKVDKLNDKGVDKFGYGAIHYIVQLSEEHSGARYDYLKKLVCEIQVRTVLQDSWSIIDHHLAYKNESEIPKQLRRKLNSLAGLFETADDQFNQIKNERENYIQSILISKKVVNNFLDNDLNLDSFKEYLSWKFPDLMIEAFPGQMDVCYQIVISKPELRKLADIDKQLEKSKISFSKLVDKLNAHDYSDSSSAHLVFALAISDIEVLNHPLFAHKWRQIIESNYA